ncbi:MAG: DDE-type integrase/transposase/recombinase [Gemmatimonadaceae bacterium]|nr:DDE-type integrase/transposase/recombinase [Gemmatimonadaceae bacterium]
MKSHRNARLGFAGRLCLVERVRRAGWTQTLTAAAFGVSERTVGKWLRRYEAEGLAVSTVGDELRRLGLGRLPPLVPRPPIVRYERATPGELLHIDAKRLGRIVLAGHRVTGDRRQRAFGRAGWECLHVAVNDASRVAFAALLPDESAASAVRFLHAAVAWLARLGVHVEAMMTDNAFCYVDRQYALADVAACVALFYNSTRCHSHIGGISPSSSSLRTSHCGAESIKGADR